MFEKFTDRARKVMQLANHDDMGRHRAGCQEPEREPDRMNLIFQQRSDNYRKQVTDLAAWFAPRMRHLPDLVMSLGERAAGTDAVKDESWRMTIDAATVEWRDKRKYELSYNQLCLAFFGAGKTTGKITFTS